jgi:hypothetical protein
MQTFLAIVLLVLVLHFLQSVPDYVWIAGGFIIGGIIALVVVWYVLTISITKLLNLALGIKD